MSVPRSARLLATVLGGALLLGVLAVPASAVPATADPVTTPGVAAAWSWLLGQRGTGTAVTTPSVIAPARDYDASWVGAVEGHFTVVGATPPRAVDPASLVVDRPTSVPATYAGALAGHVTVPPAAGRWIVQVYKDSPAGRLQVPLQAAVGVDGTFVLDLGAVSDPPPGGWALGLLDATAAYAPSGTPWPAAPVLPGWVVRALVVTDVAYPVAEQPARADGTFAFPASAPGTKVFQLVDTTTGAVLAEAAPDSGLVRSAPGGTTVTSYDQALALTTAVALGRDASDLAAGLITLQRSDGGFVDVVDVRNPAGRDGPRWTGNSAVATWALLRRLQTTSTADPAYGPTRDAAARGVGFLLAQRRADGLLGAGRTAGGAPAAAWVSTEHQLDAWQALRLAGTVLGDTEVGAAAGAAAAALGTAVVASLWDPAAAHFRQGLGPDGPDDTDALDVSSWGTLFLLGTGRPDLAAAAVAHTAAFASTDGGTTGYRPYRPQPALPAVPDDVWVEGSAGVALAQLRTGDTDGAAATVSALRVLQRPDGSLPGATRADAATGMTSDSQVAATAWFVLAAVAAEGPTIWD